MIKSVTMAICDICGRTEKARPQTFRNETEYFLPETWQAAAGNKNVHLCPDCARKLTRPEREG